MESQENATGASAQPCVHTPGPWHAFEHEGQWKVCDDTYLKRHVAVMTDGIPKGEHEGNARLIAASHDLLDACKRYLDAMDRYGHPDKTDRLMRAAIEKATGEKVV